MTVDPNGGLPLSADRVTAPADVVVARLAKGFGRAYQASVAIHAQYGFSVFEGGVLSQHGCAQQRKPDDELPRMRVAWEVRDHL